MGAVVPTEPPLNVLAQSGRCSSSVTRCVLLAAGSRGKSDLGFCSRFCKLPRSDPDVLEFK